MMLLPSPLPAAARFPGVRRGRSLHGKVTLTTVFLEQNPQTGQVVQGYYITAYRNLTTVSHQYPRTASEKPLTYPRRL